MSNELGMAMQQAILALKARGWSHRRIAREMGIHRETVGRYLSLAAKPANNPPAGSATVFGDGASKPASNPPTGSAACVLPNLAADSVPSDGVLVADTGMTVPPLSAAACQDVSRSGPASTCEPYRSIIEEKLSRGLTIQRIYQDLVAESNFQHSYDSIKRFARRLCHGRELPFRRMECSPEQEAQVDFGSGSLLGPVGSPRRRSHVFRMVLSHSRKGYSEAVSRQTTEDFLGCMENAFWHFGGVPQTVVIDNLRAAVAHPDWYDPQLNPRLEAFCRHYGTVILPTRPYTPRHKGKIERGIGYVKENALRGREFVDLASQNAHLREWESTVADTRIHGTTRQQVGKVFMDVEKAALQPLPAGRFPYFQEGTRSVHRDGHVEVAKAYYSVPPEHVGRVVRVQWDTHLVRIFNQRQEQIAVHARKEAGCFNTASEHIPVGKISGMERGTVYLLGRAAAVGEQTANWSQAMLQARGIPGVRVLVGLLSLAKRHTPCVVEEACRIALSHRSYRLAAIRELIKHGGAAQESLPLLDRHPLIRELRDYDAVVLASLR